MTTTTHETTGLEKRPEHEVARAERTRSGRFYRPNVDIVELTDELVLYADMPGATADSIDINFENGTLTIHGRVEARQPVETGYLLREYGIGDFCRSFEIGEAIDASKISAEYSNGVLVLHLPKVEAVKPRRITVQAQ